MEYVELISIKNISELQINFINLIKTLSTSKYFLNICVMLARIAVA